jgi:hypothetical protein
MKIDGMGDTAYCYTTKAIFGVLAGGEGGTLFSRVCMVVSGESYGYVRLEGLFDVRFTFDSDTITFGGTQRADLAESTARGVQYQN